ncbi:MAG TPA: M48 family metalloprotease [Candidatus Limnocylindrales bacterium]|nr:M48 family metalloprotease [Candidatus Limnocylindrales bacterium]
MILPYMERLLCLCFALFFLLHVALSLAARAAAPLAIRLGESMKPRFAARLLLVLRLSPAAISAFVVAALCVPSYLWFEPDASAERVGVACCAAALLGFALWGVSLVRVSRALFVSLRYRRQCERQGRLTRVSSGKARVFVVEAERPLLALVGIFRPRVIVSRAVLQALSPDQFNAALDHERAHSISRDNFKRLLLLFAPDILPFSCAFAALHRSWARCTEWAADDRAAAGDAQRSLSLAAALVRVARLGAATQMSMFVSSLIEDGRDLSMRVDRLLTCEWLPENPRRGLRMLLAAVSLVTAGILMAAMMRPATLYSVHRLLEHLIR